MTSENNSPASSHPGSFSTATLGDHYNDLVVLTDRLSNSQNALLAPRPAAALHAALWVNRSEVPDLLGAMLNNRGFGAALKMVAASSKAKHGDTSSSATQFLIDHATKVEGVDPSFGKWSFSIRFEDLRPGPVETTTPGANYEQYEHGDVYVDLRVEIPLDRAPDWRHLRSGLESTSKATFEAARDELVALCRDAGYGNAAANQIGNLETP